MEQTSAPPLPQYKKCTKFDSSSAGSCKNSFLYAAALTFGTNNAAHGFHVALLVLCAACFEDDDVMGGSLEDAECTGVPAFLKCS